MSEKFSPQLNKHLQILQHYMNALDTSDLATLAAILRKAEHDPPLERLLLVTNEVYYSTDGVELSQAELASAQRMIAEMSRITSANQELASVNEQAMPAHPQTSFYLLPKRVSGDEEKTMITNDAHDLTEVSTSELPARERWGKQKRQKFRWLQSLAAVLSVGVLVGGFLLVFTNYHNTRTGSYVQMMPTPRTATSSNLLIASYTPNGGNVTIAALRVETGALAWTYITQQKNVPPQILTHNQVVYVAINDQIYALHAQTGKLIWQKSLHLGMISGVNSTSSITFDHGMLYLAFAQTSTGNDDLYAFNSENGTLVWHHSIGYDQTFTASNGIVYLEISSNNIYNPGSVTALRGSDGHFLWSYTTNPIALLVANNILYIQSGHQQTPSDQGSNKQYKSLLALNTTNGHLLWSVNVDDNGPSSLVFSNNLVILYRTTDQPAAAQFCAYSSNNGLQAWCTSGKEGPWDENSSNYLVASGTLYVSFNTVTNQSNLTTTVEALNPQNGHAYWSKTVIANISSNMLTELHGALYMLQNRNVVALSTNDGHILWQIRVAGLLQALGTNV